MILKTDSIVSNGCIFYSNSETDLERFDKKMLFYISLIPYVGNTEWVEEAIRKAYEWLCSAKIPKRSTECDFCQYSEALEKILKREAK